MTAEQTIENLWIDRVWLAECSRCANEGSSWALQRHEAVAEFAEAGWTADEDHNQFCPACNNGGVV